MKSFPAFGILLRNPGQRQALFDLLEKNSGLPGPRANLELVHSFAASVGSIRPDERQWELILQMASISPSKAPVNTTREFLPVCGTVALGALYAAGLPRQRKRAALAAIRKAGSDPRWRTREASAMALQVIGETDRSALRQIVEQWLPESSLLEKRAIAAGLAHPPILVDDEFTLFCLQTARKILTDARGANGEARRSEQFRVLKQGLGYAISVFVAKQPAEGFKLLREAASLKDPDVEWIVRENLKKKRLSDKFPAEVRQVADLLSR